MIQDALRLLTPKLLIGSVGLEQYAFKPCLICNVYLDGGLLQRSRKG